MLQSFQRYWHGDQEDLRLLIATAEPGEARRRHTVAAAGALVYQVAVVLLAIAAIGSPGRRQDAPQWLLDIRRATPLVAPPEVRDFKLTQKEPQRSKPAAEVDMAALLSKPAILQPQQSPPGKLFTPPPSTTRQEPVIEAPKIDLPPQGLPLPAGGPLPGQLARMPSAPPPDAAKASPFESVGGPRTPPASGAPAISLPGSTVEEVARAAQRKGGGGIVVGDAGRGGISEALSQLPASGRNASALELLSDPQGIDFRPYLVQVLAAVRRNWQAVLPESARLGRQGRCAIQFSIDKAGRVPKLVIALPSGTEALDRAAIAGISASNPFPPLPPAFRGTEIRLQLVFSYNMPR